uniref:E3 ubiquitin-protein ligase Msl2 zinc RING finger domain-containing protein n=1 Tax=Ciona savignyi TaxID=51511 RepID=H2ZHN8_CIOSA
MDTENCTNLYLQVCQTFLTCQYDDPSSFEDLYKLLPWLRQSLTCCVCSKVVVDPMSSTQSHCQHFVCEKCRGGKMVLRPSCSWCKDADAFVTNEHLVMLVQCFSKICDLIMNSPIIDYINKYDHNRQKEVALAMKANSTTNEGHSKKRRNGTRRHQVSSRILNISVSQVLQDGLNAKKCLS